MTGSAGERHEADAAPRNAGADVNDAPVSGWRRAWRALPRTESVLLLLAMLVTLGAKLVAVHRLSPDDLVMAWLATAMPDVLFFACSALVVSVLQLVVPRPTTSRVALCFAVLVLGWTGLHAAWLLSTGVQLQPGILRVIGYSPEEFWPAVGRQLGKRIGMAIPAGVVALAAITWCLFRFVRPAPVPHRRRVMGVAVAAAVIGLLGVASRGYFVRNAGMYFSGEALGFSSHWYAMVSLLGRGAGDLNGEKDGRHVPRRGMRDIGMPPDSAASPNVVLLLLESVSHRATSLDTGGEVDTPHLARLAADGVEFVNTHVPVSQTGKAYWATLTGTTPDVHYDYSEAILVDEPYESLATILGGRGYRSAFFEMSKGTFQCAPGVFANTGFDWGWWRENLEDPGTHLGYLAGDDFRMLDPAFAWAQAEESPFLLMMITSVAHDPFLVPDWYGSRKEDRVEAYRQAVEFTDAFVGEVARRLDDLGIVENTILCVIGDHGESFRPDTRRGRWVPYEEVIRVPWVVHWPAKFAGGDRVEWPCSQMDVTPTLLSMMGFDVSRAGFDGRNALLPGDPARRLYFSSWFEDSPEGFLEGNRKVVYFPYLGKVCAFDLGLDPMERNPVELTGSEGTAVMNDVAAWKKASHVYFGPKRFRERLLFDHWRAFSSGRAAWAYYVKRVEE